MSEIEYDCIQKAIEYILINTDNINHNKQLYESVMLLNKYNIYKINIDTLTKLHKLYGK